MIITATTATKTTSQWRRQKNKKTKWKSCKMIRKSVRNHPKTTRTRTKKIWKGSENYPKTPPALDLKLPGKQSKINDTGLDGEIDFCGIVYETKIIFLRFWLGAEVKPNSSGNIVFQLGKGPLRTVSSEVRTVSLEVRTVSSEVRTVSSEVRDPRRRDWNYR